MGSTGRRCGRAVALVVFATGGCGQSAGGDEGGSGSEAGSETYGTADGTTTDSETTGEPGDSSGTGGGAELCWEDTWKPAVGMSSAWVSDLAVAPDGTVLVLSTETMPGDGDTATQARLSAFSGTGDPLWEDLVPFPAVGGGVDLDDDGDIYIAGDSGPAWPAQGWLRRYSSSGEMDWSIEFDQRAMDVEIAGGVLVVAGAAEVTDEVWDVWLSRRSPADGGEVWSASAANENGGIAMARAIAISATGDIALAGDERDLGETTAGDGLVAVWDANANPLWSDLGTVGSGRPSVAAAVAADTDGSVIAAGWAMQDGALHLWVRRYADDGTELWTELSDAAAVEDRGHAVAIAADGRIAVVGQSVVDSDVRTQALVQVRSVDGELIWTDTYGIPMVWDGEYASAAAWLDSEAFMVGGQLSVGDEGGFRWVACWPAVGLGG